MAVEEALKLGFFIEREKGELQERFVLRVLQAQGVISRNFCLQRYISRLSGIIFNLKKLGFNITGQNLKTEFGTDYIYNLEGSKLS